MVLVFRPQIQDEIFCIGRVKQAVNLQPVLGCSDITEFTTNNRSPSRQMLWLEDVSARHAECRTCTSLRQYIQNPTNRSGATLTWLPVGVGLHKHSLTHVMPVGVGLHKHSLTHVMPVGVGLHKHSHPCHASQCRPAQTLSHPCHASRCRPAQTLSPVSCQSV